jgi:hypothetical protein
MRPMAILLILTVLLFGCTNNGSEKNEKPNDETREKTTETEKNKAENKDVHVPNPQVSDDQNLKEIGQTINDSKGEITLEAIKIANDNYKIGPMELNVRDVKLIHYKPDYSMIDFFHSYTHDEEFDFVKLAVEMKNTSDDMLKFAPVAILKTSDGQQKIWEDDIYLEELGGEIKGNSTKTGTVGFIVEETKQPIQWVEFTTSDVFDQNDKLIKKGKKIKIEIERK